MHGIWHAYYTVELAPALAALVALGATLLWRRGSRRALAVLAGGSLLTTVWAVALLSWRFLRGSQVVGIAVAVAGVAAVVVLALQARNGGRRFGAATAALLVAAAVLGPAAWSVVTARGAHIGSAVATGPGVGARVASAVPVSAQALALLRQDTDDWTWTGAVVGHRAGAIQLAAGAPVLPVGGFGGSDPAPTLAQFRSDVARHRVHWFIRSGRYGGDAGAIEAWVSAHAPVVQAGGTTLYDVGALAPAGADDDDRSHRPAT
jgi:4-amino-4-deoxy-L-arabinose transferase-like glycosyltransferase